jgi:hypothetical protein
MLDMLGFPIVLSIKTFSSRLWWLMFVILATWEAKIGRLRFKARSGKKPLPEKHTKRKRTESMAQVVEQVGP